MTRDSGWPIIPPELAETLRQLDERTEPVRQALMSPAIQSLTATLADFQLQWTPEGRAVLAERAHQRRAVAGAVAQLCEQLDAAVAQRELATARTVADRRRAGWLPRLRDGLGSAADDPAVLLEEREDKDRLLAALRHLAPEEQEFLALATSEPHSKVAQQYGISVNAVKQRAKRLRREMRTFLDAARASRG
jgi:hypothetical protein